MCPHVWPWRSLLFIPFWVGVDDAINQSESLITHQSSSSLIVGHPHSSSVIVRSSLVIATLRWAPYTQATQSSRFTATHRSLILGHRSLIIHSSSVIGHLHRYRWAVMSNYIHIYKYTACKKHTYKHLWPHKVYTLKRYTKAKAYEQKYLYLHSVLDSRPP